MGGLEQGKDEDQEELYRNEVRVMLKLKKHPNVVKLLEVIDDPN